MTPAPCLRAVQQEAEDSHRAALIDFYANPRTDPGFPRRCLLDLVRHWGQWRPLGRLYCGGMDPKRRADCLRDVMDLAKHLGWVVEGDRRRGYRVVDLDLPLRVYTSAPGRPPSPPEEEPESPVRPPKAEIPGQMALVGLDEIPGQTTMTLQDSRQ